jgi:hypothetical protein
VTPRLESLQPNMLKNKHMYMSNKKLQLRHMNFIKCEFGNSLLDMESVSITNILNGKL